MIGYEPDTSVGGRDALGIAGDVDAFARLFAASAVSPPISVGIFGPWGSGKSFFMRRLEEAVTALTQTAPSNPAYLQSIVQIRFNAWHYADANLWASLTSAFFEQLQHGGADGARKARYAGLVREVARRAKSLDAASLAAHIAEMVRIDEELQALQQRKAALETKRPTEAEALLRTVSTSIGEDTRKAVKRLGLPDPSEAAGQFAQALAQREAGKKFLFRLGRFSRRFPVASSGILALSALAIIAVIAAWSSHAWTGDFWTGVATWAGGLWAVMLGVSKVADMLFGQGVAFIERFEASMSEIEKKSATELTVVAHDMEELKIRRDELAARITANASFDGAGATNAAGVLEHFLVSTGERERFDSALGLVSRARLAFETLDQILSKSSGSGGQSHELKPDRVILYIDDLDRCTPDRVYEVLQAVHLLAGFASFVSVVGVDESWVRAALQTHASFGAGAADVDAGSRPSDYLEKIFQIPFWLRPLTTSKSDAYHALVDMLSAPIGGTAPSPARIVAPELARPGGGMGPGGSGGGGGADGAKKTRKAARPPSLFIEFTDEEREWLRRLGAICSKSPRAVKRFINTARLIRVREGEADPDFYFGVDNAPGYMAILLALAVEIGRPRAESNELFSLLRSMQGGTMVGLLGPKLPAASPLKPLSAELASLVAEIVAKGPADEAAWWRRAFATARRYSFNALESADGPWLDQA